MSGYSPQVVYCNNCGTRMVIPPFKLLGRSYRCCSIECCREINMKDTLSIMGREADPQLLIESRRPE